MQAVASSRGRPIVVANGAESEPASGKDRMLLQTLPHLVLDGAQLAAEALGAREVIVALCESAPASLRTVGGAIEERGGSRGTAPMRVVGVPGDYVAGNELSLISHLNGGRAVPTFTPPMPFQQGVARRPTFVANAETLAHIALIARHGSGWYRLLGTPAQPGSALVTLSGPVARPGVYEIEHGAALAALIEAAGGLHRRARALLIGGYGGSWIDGELLGDVMLCDEQLARHDAMLGPGIVALLSDDACPVAETVRAMRWLADQSAGQCGPCVHGLGAIAASVQELAEGVAERPTRQRTDRLASLVHRRGACGHPDGAIRFLLSALDTFAGEFDDHAHHGACDACARPAELPLPLRPRSATPVRKALSPR